MSGPFFCPLPVWVPVADELRAIPVLLVHVGNELSGHGRSLGDIQRSCHRDADAAQAGWVGASARTLSVLLDGWATTSGIHQARLTEHSHGIRSVAAALTELESRNTGALGLPVQ